ncbi:MAG: hypothetical protein UZ09_BCD002000181 [Bacteroidetes bacterium OLB9]|nr:MAG: hypothetical protein UZ09_BCD002000181 [Bacteroidetes bacterium OLB9]
MQFDFPNVMKIKFFLFFLLGFACEFILAQDVPRVAADCKVIRQEIINGKKEVELQSLPFFTFTQPAHKTYFREKDLMETDATLIKSGKDYFLKMDIRMLSKDAAKNYGFISKGSPLRINYISGKTIVLQAENEANVAIENYTGHALYSVRYKIPSDELRTMRRIPLNTVGIMWSSGFELYNIYNVDVLIQLFDCIKQTNN